MAEVVLKGVSKSFGDVVAVERVDLRIEDRELLVLVGPSGCGKSTTLRMIAGLEDPTEGTIQIGDRVVNQVAPKDRDIAMVFQNYALYPHMNVYQNMAFGLRMRRVPRVEIERRVQDAAGLLGIAELLRRKPGQLSGGQRQRVALGRAIVRDPAAFLFDEPLSNLDARLRVTMRTELVKLHQRLQTTMIHVTHDQVEAMMMGHRIVVMEGGRVQQVGTPLEVYDAPANRFVAEFIGSPPMNFFEGRWTRVDGRPAVQVGSWKLPLPFQPAPDSVGSAETGEPVTLGIRPEHIQIARGDAAGLHAVQAELVVAQPLGAETLLELDAQQHQFVARSELRGGFQIGKPLEIFLDMRRAVLFDAQSGLALPAAEDS